MPRTPYSVNGVINDVNGTVINAAKVEVWNLRNGDKMPTTTNGTGAYIVELANATHDYVNADPILVRAYKAGIIFKFAESQATIDIKAGESVINLQLQPEYPEQPKEVVNRDHSTESLEHSPAENAKKVINLVDPTEGYQTSDVDDTEENVHYFGYLNKEGKWYILKEDLGVYPATYRYVKGDTGYVAAMEARVNQKYKRFNEVF